METNESGIYLYKTHSYLPFLHHHHLLLHMLIKDSQRRALRNVNLFLG